MSSRLLPRLHFSIKGPTFPFYHSTEVSNDPPRCTRVCLDLEPSIPQPFNTLRTADWVKMQPSLTMVSCKPYMKGFTLITDSF